jgi:hypothetical protein
MDPKSPEPPTGSRQAEPMAADNPMALLVSGILLLGGISALIGWGLGHAYPPL